MSCTLYASQYRSISKAKNYYYGKSHSDLGTTDVISYCKYKFVYILMSLK